MYYPLSQIKSNLHTNGGEYVTKSNGKDYIGFYYKVSNGKQYTGKTPSEGYNQELIIPQDSPTPSENIEEKPLRVALFNEDPDPVFNVPQEMFKGRMVSEYTNLNPKSNITTRSMPVSNLQKPMIEDYNLGEYQRYFCKKNNELIYLEIDKDTYKKLKSKDPKIAFDLFTPIQTPWSLKGDKTKVYLINRKIITLIERNQKWYGFTKYFQNQFLQYHMSRLTENLYTDGGEYTLPDGTNYIGFYHIMDNGNAMTGREHGEKDDIMLTAINTTTPNYSST